LFARSTLTSFLIMKINPFRSILTLFAGSSLMLASCEYPNYGYGHPYGPNQRVGTVYGATGGALLGGVIGSQSRRPLQGALIGGVVGGFAGNAIGASNDRRYYLVRGGPVYGSRYSYGRPFYSSRYFQPVYSSWNRPNYFYRPGFYGAGAGFGRPWGGSFGFGGPIGCGSRWY